MVNARMTSETGAMLPSRPMKCLRWRSMLDAAFGLRCYPGCYPETQFTSRINATTTRVWSRLGGFGEQGVKNRRRPSPANTGAEVIAL